MLLLWILVLVVGIAYLAHRRIAPLPALGIVAVYLLAMGAFSHAPGWLLLIFWVLLAAVAAPLLLPDLRRKYFSAPLFNWFQKTLPPMSQTERDAIDAGTVWWDGELFSGRPDWNKLLAYPKAQLSEEEQAFIDGPTEELCAMVSDWQIGQGHGPAGRSLGAHQGTRLFCPDHSQGVRRQGLFGLCPLPSGDETGDPQRRPRFHGDGPQLPGPGRTVAALRHRRTTQPLPATPGARRRHPLLCPDRPTGRLRRGRHARHRGDLQRRMGRQGNPRPAPELGKALHHPGPGGHPARPGVQGLRPGPFTG